jgi:hypothetical protein
VDTNLIEQRPNTNTALPALITSAGKRASWRFLEFFTVNIRNKNTRTAYTQAAGSFLRWCGDKGITRTQDVQPVHVAAYVEELVAVRSAPTVKQHLACLRLFDWLVTGQIILQSGACRPGAASFDQQRRYSGDFLRGGPPAAGQHGRLYRGRAA